MFQHSELEVAVDASNRAARILKGYFRQQVDIQFKSSFNLVSQADLESEKAIIECIAAARPTHQVLGEESNDADMSAVDLWIVDPLDGTNNFCHGIDHFAVSIAYYRNGQPELGIVHRPVSDDWFFAARGLGAWHNGKRCQVSDDGELGQVIIGTGFYYDRGEQMRQTLKSMERLFDQNVHGIRRMGTASLDLCMVGTGSFGAYFEFELAPWDFAAGRLFVEEAGGIVTNCRGDALPISNTSVIASNKKLHHAVLQTIQPCYIDSINHRPSD